MNKLTKGVMVLKMKRYKVKIKRNKKKNILGMKVMFKRCLKCDKVLFRNNFFKNKNNPSGLRIYCAKCENERYKHICEQCGKEFTSNHKTTKFCNKQCQGKWRSERDNIICNCSRCGKEIKIAKSQYNRYKNHFCSEKCRGVKQSTEGSVEHNCDYCGKEIKITKSRYDRHKNHFCSQHCLNKWKATKITSSCDYCGKEINQKKSNYDKHKNHFCSLKCLGKWRSEHVTGENHPCYNPNLTQEEREQRRKIEGYNDFINSVYERDDYTCQCCGKRGGRLNAHHVYGYAEYKDFRIDVDNGITLCEDCHKEYHKQYGRTSNDYKNFRKFLYVKMIEQNTLEARLFYANVLEDITLRFEIKNINIWE